MPFAPLENESFGPFTKGVVDRANPQLDLTGTFRRAVGVRYTGINRLSIRPGTRVVLTLKDDAAHANVTSVCWVGAFADGALAVAHSTVTSKCYLYRLTATMDGWYDTTGALQATLNPQPVAVIWTGIVNAPEVCVAEGLGVAWIAHVAALDAVTLAFPTRQFSVANLGTLTAATLTFAAGTGTWTNTGPHGLITGDTVTVTNSAQPDYNQVRAAVTVTSATIFTYAVPNSPASPSTGAPIAAITMQKVMSDLDANGTAEDLYFTGVTSFQQHLWGWGFGSGTTAATGYRAELARYSQPNFAMSPNLFASPDSITVGNRVRSSREAIVAGFTAGESLYLGGPYLVSRITGYGRSSWYRQPLNSSFGFVGSKCGVAVGDTLYYWSPRGPMRIPPESQPEALYPSIAAFCETVVNPQNTIAGYDTQTDTVFFFVDTGTDTRTFCAFDVIRDCWLGPDDDIGLILRSCGTVAPIYVSTAATSIGATAAPSSASTTSIGLTAATANWVAGDLTATTLVQYRQQGTVAWATAVDTLTAGLQSFTFSGLVAGTPYEWRAAHVKDGNTTSFLGPVAGSQFTTTTTTLAAPTSLSCSSVDSQQGYATVTVQWNNQEFEASTEVWFAGQSASLPASSAFAFRVTSDPGQASATLQLLSGSFGSGTYWFEVRHTQSGFVSSVFTAAVSVGVVITGVAQ